MVQGSPMKPSKQFPTRIDAFRHRLRSLKLKDSLKVSNQEISPREAQAWYHAARVEGMKVSVKTTPEGTRLWRVS